MCGGVLVQVNYFHFVAEEVRAGLASLGMRSMDELIGRGDLLRQRSIKLAKTEGLDLSFLTHYAGETATSSSRGAQEVNTPTSPVHLGSHACIETSSGLPGKRAAMWEQQEPFFQCHIRLAGRHAFDVANDRV